jgi:hypothetical protein
MIRRFARAKNSQLTLGRYEFLGLYDHLESPTFRVDEWWAPDSTVDLGDFMYPGELYAFLPAASRGAYLTTTKRLLATLDPFPVRGPITFATGWPWNNR